MKKTIRKYLRKLYHKLPLRETYKMKMKSFYTKNFIFLEEQIDYQEWKKIAAESTTRIKSDKEEYLRQLFSRSQEKSPEYVEKSREAAALQADDVRLIAFYLPQYHPFPENDDWWGKGFTEWTNVSKAVPQFTGHYQPHLPGELGFYDLRLPAVQQQQIDLARQYGLYGFCYYYYWFSGKRLMDGPLEQILRNKALDFPFCICWANENWSRRWDGMEDDILIKQDYAEKDDLAFIQDVEAILKDARYIRIEGKPLLVVYRIGLLPHPAETIAIWRAYCRQCGIGEIYLAVIKGHDYLNPEECGADIAVEFPPHTAPCPNVTGRVEPVNPEYQGIVYDLKAFVKSKVYLKKTKEKLLKAVMPSWDNTARKNKNGVVFYHSSPALYKEWLTDVIRYTKKNNAKDEQMVFINAWNEWGEGAHLEPDRRYGYGYLQATKEALIDGRQAIKNKKIVCVGHDAWKNGAQMLMLHIVRMLRERFHYEVHLLLKSGGPLEEEYKKYAAVYNLAKNYREPQQLENLLVSLQEQAVDIAITNTVITGDLAAAVKAHGFRVVSLVHELPGVIRQYSAEARAGEIAAQADKIVFASAYVKEKFSGITGPLGEKAVVRPQGLYCDDLLQVSPVAARQWIREKFRLPEQAQIVLGAGYADHRKGIDYFVDVAKAVSAATENVFFIWIGEIAVEMKPVVDEKMKGFPCPERLIFAGFQSDVKFFYAAADLYLMTSREDPFPSVVLEAMAACTPVIGFADAGGFADVICADTGRLVPFGDWQAMAGCAQALLVDRAELARLGACAKAQIAERYQFIDYMYFLLELLGHSYKKVSAVVPNYNYARYLAKRLENVSQQSYPLYDLVILDDGSTDGSREIIEAFKEKNPSRLKVIYNDENSGNVFKQWASGIAAADGDYIWLAEADDFAAGDFVEAVVKGFDDPAVVLSYCQSKQVNAAHAVIAPDYLEYTANISRSKWQENYICDGTVEICTAMAVQNTIPNVSSVLFKRVDLTEILAELLQWKNAGDWFFYIWLLQKGRIAYQAKALNCHCRHEHSVTLDAKNAANLYKEIVAMQAWIQAHFPLTTEIREKTVQYQRTVKKYLNL